MLNGKSHPTPAVADTAAASNVPTIGDQNATLELARGFMEQQIHAEEMNESRALAAANQARGKINLLRGLLAGMDKAERDAAKATMEAMATDIQHYRTRLGVDDAPDFETHPD